MKEKNNLNFAFLTALACLMVVFFHTNNGFEAYSNTVSWRINCAERCIVCSAIPIFFMLTGAKLLNYRERYGTREYVKKRLLRVGIPFLFWNLFAALFRRLAVGAWSFSSIRAFIEQFLNSEFQPRYWFFFPLFAVYAAIPVVSLLCRQRKYLWYTVLVSFALTWVLRPLGSMLSIHWNSYLMMPVSGGFLGYVLFGYLVSTEVWSRKKRMVLYALAAAGSLFAFFWTWQSSAAAGETAKLMVDYSSFPAALLGAAVFVLVRHLDFSRLACRPRLAKALLLTADASMGIWLTHTFCLVFLDKLTAIPDSGYVWRFAVPIVTFLLCLVGVRIVKHIPVLKRLV